MKKDNTTSKNLYGALLTIILILAISFNANAQENKRRHFSPEEFQKHQREYITAKAGLTQEEADRFFPIFFELQKKKFTLEQEARKSIKKERGEKMNEEQCREFVNKMSEVKIDIAKLEKEYTAKYLEVIPACKLLGIQHAETTFQRDLMKRIMRGTEYKNFKNNEGNRNNKK